MKKRGMTLLEVMIGLQLLGMLLAFLFFSLRDQMQMEVKMEGMSLELSQRLQFQHRLQDICLALTFEAEGGLFTKIDPDTKETRLYFTFDQGIDPDPLFSGKVQGELFLEKGQLCLQIQPDKAEGSVRQEVLIESVEHCVFSFLDEKGALFKDWEPSKELPPRECRIEIQKKGEKVPYVFFPPTHFAWIDYKEEK